MRFRPILSVMALLTAGALGLATWETTHSEKPEAPEVDVSKSSVLEFCKNTTTPQGEQEQEEFFKTHKVLIHGQGSNVWLDYPVKHRTGAVVYIRFYAGRDDEPGCVFGLVSVGNKPEINAEMLHYVMNGEEFTPTANGTCFSYVPPVITKKNGDSSITISCYHAS